MSGFEPIIFGMSSMIAYNMYRLYLEQKYRPYMELNSVDNAQIRTTQNPFNPATPVQSSKVQVFQNVEETPTIYKQTTEAINVGDTKMRLYERVYDEFNPFLSRNRKVGLNTSFIYDNN